ncbi:MAG: thiamine pyrophosphate-dependent dehydrogenase E1 component subunit alpha [Thermoleophilia bacterium]|nr:thiamine pyrophosphate-dependent dehydrogenase E1 component subunit alpha [Thermoleophilia bacterium]
MLDLYRRMLVIRRFEEALIALTERFDVGHFHVYIGQEVTGVPALAQLEPGDVGFTTHRNHGHLLARGVDPGRMIAEILGRATGTNGGKGGTLHIASFEHGFPTTSAATGGCVPLATGAAFGFQRLGSDRVSVCLFGDGALEEGAYWESVNIAALEQLPLIFLCENNSLDAAGQRANEYPSSTLAARYLTDLAAPFGVPTATVDGLDAKAVHEAMAAAIERARGGGGPTFIEAQTVRWAGSKPLWPELRTGRTELDMAWGARSTGGEYRAWYEQEDGLLGYTRELLTAGHVTPDDVLALDREVCAQIDAAVQFGLDSPFPPTGAALRDVFVEAA